MRVLGCVYDAFVTKHFLMLPDFSDETAKTSYFSYPNSASPLKTCSNSVQGSTYL